MSWLFKKKKEEPPKTVEEVEVKKQKYLKQYLKEFKNSTKLKEFKNEMKKWQEGVETMSIEQLANQAANLRMAQNVFNENARKRGFASAANEYDKTIQREEAERKEREEANRKKREANQIRREAEEKQRRNNETRRQVQENKRFNNLASEYGYATRNNLKTNAAGQRRTWRFVNPHADYLNLESFIRSDHFKTPSMRREEEANRARKKTMKAEANRKRKEQERLAAEQAAADAKRREEERLAAEQARENAETLSLNEGYSNNGSESELSMGQASLRSVSPQQLVNMIPDCNEIFRQYSSGYVSRRSEMKKQACYAEMDRLGLELNQGGGKRRKTRKQRS